MLAILKFWASKGVDGFRCDMAHMVPVEFWHWAISQIKEANPHVIFIAEIYDVALYRSYIFDGGFDYLYDKVTLYDTLRGIMCEGKPASDITRCWQTVEGIGEHMLNFLENHDEQRIASRQFLGEPFKAIPALVLSTTISRCPFMLYAGQELGEPANDSEGFSGLDGRTTIFDYWSLPSLRRWHQGKPDTRERKLRAIYRRILRLTSSQRTLASGEFFDLMYVNQDTLDTRRQFAYLRHCDHEMTLIVVNFGDNEVHADVRMPKHALECSQLSHGTYCCTELLTGETVEAFIDGEVMFKVDIDPHGVTMWHFTRKAGKTMAMPRH